MFMAVDYLLDTNVCIQIIRGQVPDSSSPVSKAALEWITISSITLAELEVGVAKAARSAEQRRQVDEFLTEVTVLDFDRKAALHYGEIRADLEKKGKTIGPLDLLIAAHARSLAATIVTANLREFKRVPGLKCLAW